MTKFLALVLSLLIVFSLTAIFGRIDWADQAACLLVLALPVLAFAQLRVREAYLLIICVALTATAYWLGHDLAGLIWMGLSQSAYLASFILLVALLREAAVSSKSVVAIGHFLTRQPPHRRFTAIFSGAHALAVMINLGALSLLAPIIQKGMEDAIFSNPLPQVLILTAIVVGISTTALGLAIVVRIYEAYGTIEEDETQRKDIEG